MKLEDVLQSGNEPKIWTPTMHLRWKIKDIDFDMINKQKVLQQLWKGYMNDQEEWRDIEIGK